MRIIHKVSVKTYDCTVLYILTDNMKKTEKYLLKKYNGELSNDFDSAEAEGITISINGKIYACMIDCMYLSHNTIAHELYHVTRRITEDRDINDEESIAWLSGYLAEEFYHFVELPKVKKEFQKLTEKIKNGTGTTESK